MTRQLLFEHNDAGDYLLTIEKCRQQTDDPAYVGYVEVSIDGRTCCLSPSQRRAAATALIGSDYTIISDADYIALARERDQLKAAQPDRPEPVDPASLKVGDLVEYELLPEYKPCRIVGEVEGFHFGGAAIQLHGHWWNTKPGMATVRVLRRAEPEPEPDPAAVEALAKLLEATWAAGGMGAAEQAGLLIRRGVTAPEVPNAE